MTGHVGLALLGLATMVAAAFIGLGEDLGAVVMAAAGGLLTVVGVWAAWPERVGGDDDTVG